MHDCCPVEALDDIWLCECAPGGGTGGLDRVSGGRFGGGFGGRFGDGFWGWEQLVLTDSGVGSKNGSMWDSERDHRGPKNICKYF